MRRLEFIDLFAGLGGFHLALEHLGQDYGFRPECVFASELREDLRVLYSGNYNIPFGKINSDITQLDTDEKILEKIPPHKLLCAGFPCQPFSKAGKRQGFNDKEGRGILFNYIEAILRLRHPKYILLENVANLETHDGGNTWKTIKAKLEALDYDVDQKILSPHEFGIPQHRKRIYIVGVYTKYYKGKKISLKNFAFPKAEETVSCHISQIVDEKPEPFVPLKDSTKHQLDVWQDFVDLCVQHTGNVPKSPIWAMEFGATYDYEDKAPAYQDVKDLIGKKGDRGKIITGPTMQDCLNQLPSYARGTKEKQFPDWKRSFIKQNRDFYTRNKPWLDDWLLNIQGWENSHIKLEWNCTLQDGTGIYNKIIQYRPSGIRVKRPTFSPALTYMGSQVPIFPWANGGRYMTETEAARLQGMSELKFGLLSRQRTFEALGNAVNVDIVKLILEKLIQL